MVEHRHAAARRSADVHDFKRARIRDAAKRVFADRGIHDTTMRQIAAVAGWSTGALYQYYSSKEELYADVLRQSLAKLRDYVQSSLQQAGDERGRAALRALWAYYDARGDEFDLGFYLYRGARPVGLGNELNRELNQMLNDVINLIAGALLADGLVAQEDAHRIAMARATSIFGLVLVAKTGRLHSMQPGYAPEEMLDILFADLDWFEHSASTREGKKCPSQ